MIPHEKERLDRILYALDLPENQWILAGSGVLVLHGIDRGRPMGDVDIFCSTRLWFQIYFDALNPGRAGAALQEPWKIFTTDPKDIKRRVDPAYLYKEMHSIEVNVFSSWRQRSTGNIDVGFWMANAEKIQGWPCVPLQLIMDWKVAEGRAKDVTDIAQIKKHLERRSS